MNRRERRQQRSDTYKARQEYDRLYSKGIGVRFDSWNGEWVARGSFVTAMATHPKLQHPDHAPKSQRNA